MIFFVTFVKILEDMKRFAILAAAVVALAACKKQDAAAPYIDDINQLLIYPGMSYTLAVTEGSGHYQASTDSKIADLSFEYGIALTVKTKEGASGSAPLVITDTESGKTVKCTLVVGMETKKTVCTVDEVKYVVNANSKKDEIEADLKTKLLPVGTKIDFDPLTANMNDRCTGKWEARSNNLQPLKAIGQTLASGTFYTIALNAFNLPSSYGNMPMNQTVNSAFRIVMRDGDIEYAADMFWVANKTIADVSDIMFYVDATAYYQKLFPNAGVSSVVYRYTQRYSIIP